MLKHKAFQIISEGWVGFPPPPRTIVLQLAQENVAIFKTSILYGVSHLLHLSTINHDITRNEESMER